MRCVACNTELNDFEATRKNKQGDYIDLCNYCFDASEYDFETYDRLDLLSESEILSVDNENVNDYD